MGQALIRVSHKEKGSIIPDNPAYLFIKQKYSDDKKNIDEI